MSRLIRAFTDMMEGNHKSNPKKVKEAETFKKSEFKKLIQQELSPVMVQRSSSSKYKNMKNALDSDAELMTDKETVPCAY
uniref:Epidermal differentiation protein n=1 Tax=Anolis carolinensis TaxID=28377 RepID=A0A089NBF1_ANOCA|nr:epidermal differentiation protein [Anolis carolinensis]